MNDLLINGGVIGIILFIAYRMGFASLLTKTIEQTSKEDKSLEKQQFENQAKLSQVNREIKNLKEEHERLKDENLTDEEKAAKWNQPPG
jgi:septal ring factor EnvC (AmiA/AmiB activator)